MKNREELPMNSNRGSVQCESDFVREDEQTVPEELLRPELTDSASVDQPALDVFSNDALMERVVDSANLDRAWRQVKRNRGAPGATRTSFVKARLGSTCSSSWNRLVRIRLLGGVGAGVDNAPATRFRRHIILHRRLELRTTETLSNSVASLRKALSYRSGPDTAIDKISPFSGKR